MSSPVLTVNLLRAILTNYAGAVTDGHHIDLPGAILLRQVFASSDLPPKLKVTRFKVGSASIAVRHMTSLP